MCLTPLTKLKGHIIHVWQNWVQVTITPEMMQHWGFLPESIQTARRKYYRLGSLQTTEIYFSPFWRLKVWDQGDSLWYGLFSLCPHMVEGARGSPGAFYRGTNAIHEDSALRTQAPPKAPHLLIPSSSGIRISTRIWGRHIPLLKVCDHQNLIASSHTFIHSSNSID